MDAGSAHAASGSPESTLTAVLLLLTLGMPLVLLARRLGVSALISYLITGAIAGAFHLVDSAHIHLLAEIGASLLLFSLGLEMDLMALRRRLRQVLIGAVGQIGSTIAVGTLVMWLLNWEAHASFAIGCCLALSSTLMVLRALDEKKLRNRDEGQTVLGLLLAQDFSLAPLLLILAMVLPSDGEGQRSPAMVGLGTVALIAATVFGRRVLASRVLRRVRAAQLPELEVAFSVTVALGSAFLAESAGISAAVGAFCAGLALGGDEHRHAIETATRPLQGLMAIIFFVSIGLQFDALFVWNNLVIVSAALVVSMVLKAALAGFALRLSGMSMRSAIGCGIMVGQIGEFSFVLAAAAHRGGSGPLNGDTYQLIVAIACLSLAATPALIALATRFLPKSGIENIKTNGETIVVAGLGPVGNTVVETLNHAGAPLMLVDRNEKLLDPWRNTEGIRIHQGRIEDMEDWMPVLGERPRVVILTFPIPDTSALVADRLRRMDPRLVIIARSPYLAQVPTLTNAGVQYVICDETAAAAALGPILEAALASDDRNLTWQIDTTKT